jgi:hypothetical protein
MDSQLLDIAHTRCAHVSRLLSEEGALAQARDQTRATDDPGAYRARALYLLWARSALWMRSIVRLTSTEDYQAIGSATRSLFELCVDSVLIARRDQGHALRYLLQAQSERADYFRRIAKHYADRHLPIPTHFGLTHEEVAELGRRVAADRQTYWPHGKGRHPQRDIGQSAREADAEAPQALGSLGMSFTEFYEIDYRTLSMLVHAGTSSIDGWGWPQLGALVGSALNQAWIFALVGTQMLASQDGFGGDSERVNARVTLLLKTS